jgi:hypothetical protein
MACNSINLAVSTTSSKDACINAYLNLYTLYYIDGTDLSDSTVIYSDSDCTGLVNSGFYSDGTNVVQTTVGTIINYGECGYSSNLRNCCDSLFSESLDIFEFTNINDILSVNELPVGYVISLVANEENAPTNLTQCYEVVSSASTLTLTGVTLIDENYSDCSDCRSTNNITCYYKPGVYRFYSCDFSSIKYFEITSNKTISITDYVIYLGTCYNPDTPSDNTPEASFSGPDGDSCSDPICVPTPSPTPTTSIYLRGCCDSIVYISQSNTFRSVGNIIFDSEQCYLVINTPSPLPPSPPSYNDSPFDPGIYSSNGCSNNECPSCPTPTPTLTSGNLTPTPTPTQTNTTTPTPTQTRTPSITPSTTPIICGSGTTTGTYYYIDCCGNLIQGTSVGLIVSIDYTKPYNGVVKLNVPATTVCITQTQTPTTSLTPTPTLTPSVTPTLTQTPTPTKTPSVSVTSSPLVVLKNECEVLTLFDMGLQCYTVSTPTSNTSSDGIISVLVTGGTSPYSFYWEGGQRAQTLVGVPQGSYEVTVVDYYGDYTATTICDLFAPSPSPTPTNTVTPTNTPAPSYPSLCLIYVGSNVSYGPIQFYINGTYNGKPTWSGVYNQFQYDIQWSIQNSRWEIPGWSLTTGIPVSINSSNVPDSGWSMAGGQQATLSMTQGNCPSYLPLMSVPTVQNQTCPANLNGSITLMTNYGVPPYEYSINGGVSYQSSNIFPGLSSSTYTVITRDSATPTKNTLSNTVTVSSLGQNANYTIGIVVDSVVNLSPGSQLASWRVNITPPLPIGTTISFSLPVNTTKGYYLPGTGTINGTTVVKKNNLNVGIAGQSSTPLVNAPRAFCSPYTSGTTTTTTTYSITMGHGDVVSGTSLSDLVITNGQVGANSCATKLEQSILISTVSPTITGGVCNSVTNNPQPQGINNHTVTQANIPCTGTKWINWTGATGGNFALDGGGTVSLTSSSSNATAIQSVYEYNRLVCPDKNPNTTAQGINQPGKYTYTFSEPVLNPLLAIYSLGRTNPGPITVTISADTAFSIYCNTVSNPDYQIVYNIPNQTFSGDEGNGIIQFSGLVSQIVLDNLGPYENFTQLTWGLPCATP